MSTVAPTTDAGKAIARAFADLLSYPYESPRAAAETCLGVIAAAHDEARALITTFIAHVDATPLGELQEEYTRVFDLDTMSRSEATCYPYVGHYLFDESHKRGAFILGLRVRFRAAGFTEEVELPDHLVILLRFLSVTENDEMAEELIVDAILPALMRMGLVGEADDGDHRPGRDAYLGLIRALERTLAAGRETSADPVDLEAEREWLRNRDSLGIERSDCGH